MKPVKDIDWRNCSSRYLWIHDVNCRIYQFTCLASKKLFRNLFRSFYTKFISYYSIVLLICTNAFSILIIDSSRIFCKIINERSKYWKLCEKIFKKFILFYNNSLDIIILIFIMELNFSFSYILILLFLFLNERIENTWRLLMFFFNGMIYIFYWTNWYNLIFSMKKCINIFICKND